MCARAQQTLSVNLDAALKLTNERGSGASPAVMSEIKCTLSTLHTTRLLISPVTFCGSMIVTSCRHSYACVKCVQYVKPYIQCIRVRCTASSGIVCVLVAVWKPWNRDEGLNCVHSGWLDVPYQNYSWRRSSRTLSHYRGPES